VRRRLRSACSASKEPKREGRPCFKEQLIAVFMVQQAGPLRTHHRTLIRQLVYQALAD
jgi:hypothetical protein